MRWILATIIEPRRKEETQPYIQLKRVKDLSKLSDKSETIYLMREGEGKESGFCFTIDNNQRFASAIEVVAQVKDVDSRICGYLTTCFQNGQIRLLKNSEKGLIHKMNNLRAAS